MHKSVLLDEIIAIIKPSSDKVYLDCTFGAGGYSRALLNSGARVYAIDRDKSVIPIAASLSQEYDNLQFYSGNFSDIEELMSGVMFDGVIFDFGTSSMQLDQAERGFSFEKEALLDMRMNQADHITAKDLINELPADELANIFYKYGGETKSRQIASRICKIRETTPITTTIELARIVAQVYSFHYGNRSKTHPATKTFQAIRIAVNNELEEIAKGLASAQKLLTSGGILAAVSFHSLEDGIVKNFMRQNSGYYSGSSRYDTTPSLSYEASLKILTKSPITPSKSEVFANPRSRSAKLRIGTKI